MKKFLRVLAASIFMLPLVLTAQTSYNAQAGVSFFSVLPATATQTAGPVRLPTFSGTGILNITESGITGSPSGCEVILYYQGNNAATKSAAVATIAFTPSTGVQALAVSPSVAAGDNYVATYTCTATYPTAGFITVSFSPIAISVLPNTSGVGDPCLNAAVAKSSVAVSITSATTTQLVALSSGKTVYVCGFNASLGLSDVLTFEYGTGSACGTGTTALTGAYTSDAAVVAAPMALGGSGTVFAGIASNALCALTTGTGGIRGQLTYVQQ